MTPRRQISYPRLPVVALGILAATALVGVRLIWLGAFAPEDTAPAMPQTAIRPQRGAIWTRHGELLALETYEYDVGAATNEIEDMAAFATAVGPLLGLAPSELLTTLAQPDRRWVPLAGSVSAITAGALEQLDLDGLYVSAQPRRTYPLGAAAAHITGFVNAAGEACCGVEGAYARRLIGHAGNLAGNFGTDPRSYQSPQSGTDLVLTIDRTIQLAASEALAKAVVAQSARGGTIIVLEPTSGDILASTSLPSYDPNHYAVADPAAYLDPAISLQYEPGSVIKAMTMAAALDSGVVGVESSYEDTGVVEIAGLTVANWDRLAHGQTTMTEMLQYSLNVGAVHLARALGSDRLYARLAAFGFGHPTGVDLAGEIGGVVHTPANEPEWYEGNLATNSFGQGMAATPLQVAAAYGAIANDGQQMLPHIVAAFAGPDGRLEHVPPRPVRQVISPATAQALRAMLRDVVDGRETKAAIPGYSVGGKTGTSQIPIPGGYDTEGTIASFCGFVPVGAPRVIILVKIDRPAALRGSDVATPVFREVARAAIDALDIPPDRPITPVGVQQ